MRVKAEHRRKSLENKSLNKESLPLVLGDFLTELKNADDAEDRQKAAVKILNLLSSEFGLPKCRLKLYDERRPTVKGRKPKNASRDMKYWYRGLYEYEPRKQSLIKIWNISVCEVVLDGEVIQAERTLSWIHIVNVLLHEFIHHYDIKGLKIEIDHDLGFWKRFQHLRKLVFSHVNVSK